MEHAQDERFQKNKMEAKLKYTIGIDLGTTNSVLAYCQLHEGQVDDKPIGQPDIRLLKIPQLVDTGTIEYKPSLASFSYLANDAESASGALDLPWTENRKFASVSTGSQSDP